MYVACMPLYICRVRVCMRLPASSCSHVRPPASAWHYSTNSKEFAKLINSAKLRKIRNAMNFAPNYRAIDDSSPRNAPAGSPLPTSPCQLPLSIFPFLKEEMLIYDILCHFRNPLPGFASNFPCQLYIPTPPANSTFQHPRHPLPTSSVDVLATVTFHHSLLTPLECKHPLPTPLPVSLSPFAAP